MRLSVNRQALILLLFAAGFGCAAPEIKEYKPVWPMPPQEPRMAYIKSFTGEMDFAKTGFWEVFTGEEPGGAKLVRPQAVASDKDGRIYVVDAQIGGVFVISEKKGEEGFYVFPATLMGMLGFPGGVAVDKEGDTIYISDIKQKKVFGFTRTGGLKVSIGKPGEFERPTGLAVSEALKRLYVIDTYGHKVRAYTTKGEFLFEFGQRGHDVGGEFNFPTFAAIDSKEDIYVVDSQNFKIQVFDKDGRFLRSWGQVGDVPGTFSRPKGIGVDSDDNVYIIDAALENMQIFDKDANILLYLGAPGGGPGFFNLPAGMYIDKSTDRMYVADGFNGRVQVFQYISERFKKQRPEEYQEILDRFKEEKEGKKKD